MEVILKRSLVVEEEKRVDECVGGGDIGKFGSEASTLDGQRSKSFPPDRKDSSISKQILTTYASERSLMYTTSRPSSSSPNDLNTFNQEDHELEFTRSKMGEARQENGRLKLILAQIVKDYQSLQTHFFHIVQQEDDKKPANGGTTDLHQETEESELVSLRLGTGASRQKKEEKTSSTSNASRGKEDEQMEAGLTLGLDCRFDRSSSGPSEPRSNLSTDQNSLEETEEEEAAGQPWPPSKILKKSRFGDDEASQRSTHVKKARVSVRARCDAPTMNDGCQWRKYGQKIAKGNPCPRAYYRCTVAPACPVRKQVQRCADDMSILITTYEGTHNHPLPVSATAMASTTSAAACMLTSGSSASRQATGAPAMATSTTAGNASCLHGINYDSLSDDSKQRQFFLLPNPSISYSPAYPTITLDLTSSSSTSTQFVNRFSSNLEFPLTPRILHSPTSFNFASPESNTNTTPTTWSSNNKSHGGKSQAHSFFYQSYLQKAANSAPLTTQHPLTDTIAAATKAITSDPSFRSALAAAITSVVVGGHGNQAPTGNGCGSNYLNGSSSSSSEHQQQGNVLFFPPPLGGFSSSKSASGSPVDDRDHIN